MQSQGIRNRELVDPMSLRKATKILNMPRFHLEESFEASSGSFRTSLHYERVNRRCRLRVTGRRESSQVSLISFCSKRRDTAGP